jgi:endonuclease YncB( thermonuclease family)
VSTQVQSFPVRKPKAVRFLMTRNLIILASILIVISANDAAAEIVGRASVVDGDTIEIRGQRIRLFGIDAPESRQLCTLNDKPYRCGQQSALALADKIGERTVRCAEQGVDHYQRIVAVCYVGNEELNGWLVKQGWALAFRKYSLDYVSAEDEARVAKRGVWRGDFEMPWEWRATHPRHVTGNNDPIVRQPT